MRDKAVAELKVEKTASGVQWLIKSCDRQIDRAIAEAFPTERCLGDVESGELGRTLLVDEVMVRIADADAVFIGRAGIEGEWVSGVLVEVAETLDRASSTDASAAATSAVYAVSR
ncbi:hypothetical protein HFP43_31305 [Streptomyces sp. SJ1-7]|nr:hypothetical protein [Streptomyces sp. SJ1-7]